MHLEGRHGSNAGVFFRALKFTFVMNLLQMILFMSCVTVPFAVYYGDQETGYEVLVPSNA